MLTEDYYVANKLMKGFLGSANVDTNSRLCMASTVAGHRRAFGADVVPGCYEDLDEADLIVLVGSNAAWCHPVLFQRMMRNRRERGAKIVVIDPRRTATGDEADLFLPIAPGTDTALFCGLLVHLAEIGALDQAYIDAHTDGLRRRARARPRDRAGRRPRPRPPPASTKATSRASSSCSAPTTNAVTCFSQGVNQSAQGTDKVNAIINCHLATGRIGKPGMGPFSLTGQPNAMGGREVGGLANQLAAHMGFAPDDVDRVRRFWNAPRMAEREGLKAVQMFEAIERGEIKALWVMATNPAVSLPRAGAVREALKKLELFVVSENVLSNDTVVARRRMCCCRPPPGARRTAPSPIPSGASRASARSCRCRARPSRTGGSSPRWRSASGLGGRVRLSQRRRRVPRARGAVGLRERRRARVRSRRAGDDLRRGLRRARAGAMAGARRTPRRSARLFADGGFFTPDRKARFIAPEPPALREATSAEFPLRLNTGRLRDQWHTMTRTGPEPEARRAPAGAVRRNPSARRQGARAVQRRLRPGPHRGTAPARSRS